MVFKEDVIKQWEKNLERLKDFKDHQGHCMVPPDWEDPKLAQWVDILRKHKNKLPPGLKSKLIELDFDFSDSHFPWEEKFQQLKDFAKKFGHVHVPATDPQYEDLNTWLISQIKNRHFLSQERFQKLDYMGVVWEFKDLRDWKWHEMYLQLEAYYQEHGHSKVPQKWDENPKLSNWVLVQRRRYAEGKMKQDRLRKLKKLDFVWDFRELYEDQWEEKFNQLLKYKQKHGHCRVPLSHPDQKLAGWVDRQRTLKSKNKLLPEREDKLKTAGFIWDCNVLQEKKWEERFSQLKQYKQTYGDCFVPVNWKKNRSLGIWVSGQRTLEKKGKLDPEKKKKLDNLGFVWNNKTMEFQQKKYDEIWERNFKKLKAYQKKYGRIQVSVKIDRPLERWTCAQRKSYYDKKLSPDKINKLDRINFPWNLSEAYWMKRYEQLVEFKKRFGHTRVPWGWEENHKLGQWVSRTRLNQSKLTDKQIKLLNKINFDWKVVKKTMIPWMVMYKNLVEFKKSYGHTRVPVNWEKNRKLGKWISRIRSEQNKLQPERKKLLEEINFDWKKRRGRMPKREIMMESA
ncbi:MAG: helicase associated domain-containing protein [Candidatus Cyclobacteriaceae bacterium M3_2C_046]